jgi:hypothetical protein
MYKVLLLAVFLVVIAIVPAFAVVINGTTVAGNQITITGTGFTGTLTVALAGTKLAVVSSTATQIVATMNPVPPAGTYRLVVKAGNASGNAYIGISTGPNVVAQVALTGQTQPIPQTTLLTPQTNGLYRVSVYMASSSSSGSWPLLVLYWTDDVGPQQCGNECSLLSNFNVGTTFIVRAIAGSSISYSVGPITQGQTLETYNLFITVEQL